MELMARGGWDRDVNPRIAQGHRKKTPAVDKVKGECGVRAIGLSRLARVEWFESRLAFSRMLPIIPPVTRSI